MLVRSQDRCSFVNINTIKKVDVFQYLITEDKSDWRIDCPSVGVGSNVIGRYSTKEKAIKVLDMICDAYDRYSRACINYSKTGWDLYQTVFEMPKDEDVVITDENGVVTNGNR